MTTLYLMLGYPGAGKTTVAKLIAKQSGAHHVWADEVRKDMFPSRREHYTQAENDTLYGMLNDKVADLLGDAKDVVYDTAFNYRHDRDLLREIAKKHDAKTVLIWVRTPRDLAESRAVIAPLSSDHRVLGEMSKKHFERLSDSFEKPQDDEPYISIVGKGVTEQVVGEALKLSQGKS